MPSKVERKFNTFVKGFVTEAGPLTFPENATLDEDNFVLNRDGSRERRLGIDYDDGYTMTDTGITETNLHRSNVNFFRWDSPAGDTSLSIGVIRIRNKLWYVNLLAESPSDSFLNDGEAFTVPGMGNGDIDFAVIDNRLVLVGSTIPMTVVISYSKSNGYVFAEQVPLLVRDIWGVEDGFDPNYRPSAVDINHQHHYNLKNQGWSSNIKVKGVSHSVVSNPNPRPFYTSTVNIDDISAADAPSYIGSYYNSWQDSTTASIYTPGGVPQAVTSTQSTIGYYPSNADIWTLGKVEDVTIAEYQSYDPAIMAKNNIDNVYIAKGSQILDAYNRGTSRKLLFTSSLIPSDTETGRVSTVTSYASRIFYAGVESSVTDGDIRSPNYSGYIFFSQVVTNKEKISLCYQDADPTSPEISDIIDTDGGTIHIPEATKIVKLVSSLGSLIVFAENGIWEIYGDSGGFTATSYQLSKISSAGVTNGNSIIETNGQLFAWTNNGIYLLTIDDISARYKAENITEATIQTYYNAIPRDAKDNARVVYDSKNNRIRWMYNDTTGYNISTGLYKYNKELILDLTIKAFYPSSVYYTEDASIPYLRDYIDMPDYSVAYQSETIVVGTDTVVVGTDEVFILDQSNTEQPTNFRFLTTVGGSFTISQYKNPTYYDWVTYNGTGYDFSSYLVTGYDIAGDIFRTKHVPYIFTYFKKTEDGFTDNGTSLTANNQSSCFVQGQWEWHNTSTGNKWGTAFQAYRIPRSYIPSDDTDIYDTGENVIVTKNKLRGSGKALSLKFSSEAGKGIKLLGWGYDFVAPQAK